MARRTRRPIPGADRDRPKQRCVVSDRGRALEGDSPASVLSVRGRVMINRTRGQPPPGKRERRPAGTETAHLQATNDDDIVISIPARQPQLQARASFDRADRLIRGMLASLVFRSLRQGPRGIAMLPSGDQCGGCVDAVCTARAVCRSWPRLAPAATARPKPAGSGEQPTWPPLHREREICRHSRTPTGDNAGMFADLAAD